MTKDRFFNQNQNFEDKHYYYAIHNTDGGARYLFQVDKELNNFDSPYTMRLDGADIKKLSDEMYR